MRKMEETNKFHPHMQFREAFNEEFGQIIELQKKIFHVEQKIPADDIEGFLARNPLCWCAVCDGKIISAAAAWEEGSLLHWGRFVTDSPYRQQHIGTRLAQYSFADIFSRGYPQVYMEAREVTANMIIKWGGKIVGETIPFYEGTVTPLILTKEEFFKNCGCPDTKIPQ